MTDKEIGELWREQTQVKQEYAPARREDILDSIRKLVEERKSGLSEHWCGTTEELHVEVLRSFAIPLESWKP